jgi:hypothetical protein
LANITAKSLLKMSVAVVKDGLTLVPWVKQDHMFVAVLDKEPRQTIFQALKLLKLGKDYSIISVTHVCSSFQN